MIKICRKYKRKYLENKQKNRKNEIFNKKNVFRPYFCAITQIFFVILRPKCVSHIINVKSFT